MAASEKVRGFLLVPMGMMCLSMVTLATAKPPSILSVRANSAQIGLYEKFELRIDLKAAYSNPFDPDEIDLRAEFTAPSGRKWNVCGFYNPSSWAALWMVRFSPTEKGTWRYVVSVTDSESTAKSRVGTFTAVASPHYGFVKIAPNQRYLRYDDGTSFYGVGMWYNDSYERFNEGRVTEVRTRQLEEARGKFHQFFPDSSGNDGYRSGTVRPEPLRPFGPAL